MSCDLLVRVRRPLTLPAINEALLALGAPFAVGVLRLVPEGDGAQPDWSQPFQNGFYQAFPIQPELSFQCLAMASVDFDGEAYALSTEFDDHGPEVAWIVAFAMARSGGGKVVQLATGDEFKGSSRRFEEQTQELIAKIAKVLEGRVAQVPAEIAAWRAPRPDDTVWTHFERVALREHPEDAVVAYLRGRARAALGRSDDAEIERLLAATPPRAAFLEPLLDACFHARRPDLGRRVLSHFGAHARDHLIAAAGYVGAWAVPYLRFVLGLGVIEFDAELRERARRAAADEAMREALASA